MVFFLSCQARLDSTIRVIRARDERVSMRRVERQFISMAVVMLLLVGIVLIINTVIIYCVRGFIHDSEVYFLCLQVRSLHLSRRSFSDLKSLRSTFQTMITQAISFAIFFVRYMRDFISRV